MHFLSSIEHPCIAISINECAAPRRSCSSRWSVSNTMPRAQQRFVMQVIDTVLAQEGR
jgi:hypothetical protein